MIQWAVVTGLDEHTLRCTGTSEKSKGEEEKKKKEKLPKAGVGDSRP